MFDYGIIDSHIHLTNQRVISNLSESISSALDENITGFIGCALTNADVEAYSVLDSHHVVYTAGVHPYEQTNDSLAFDDLVRLCDEKQICGIGEIGLDKRNTDLDSQISLFAKQLDLALQYDLPVVIHCVKSYYETLKIIRKNFSSIRGYFHSFGGSVDVMENVIKTNLMMSIGNSTLAKKKVLPEIIKSGRYIFESDAPYTNGFYSTPHILKVNKIINAVQEDRNKLIEIQYKNICEVYK